MEFNSMWALSLICDSNIQHPHQSLPDAGHPGSKKGWGEQDWGAR